ncbi:hypothetical protein C9890_0064 [Perkinsus sp. BL_2016]|nr:hypothetical protein C9890_0064 [Perkinsus sp. BL_2016]
MQRSCPLPQVGSGACAAATHLGHPLPCAVRVYVLVKPEPGHVCHASRTRPHPQHPQRNLSLFPASSPLCFLNFLHY